RVLPPDLSPLIGDRMPVKLHLTAKETGAIALDDLALTLASGTVTGNALFANPDRSITAHLQAKLPDLATVKGLLGPQTRGSAEIRFDVSGTEQQPRLELTATGDGLSAASSSVNHADARLQVSTTGPLGGSDARIVVDASGHVTGVARL